MKHKNAAFTLVEIMMIFAIIGIILVFSTQLLKGRINQYMTPYSIAFRAMQKVSYNVLADVHCPNAQSEDPECCTPESKEDCLAPTRPFPMDRTRGDGVPITGHIDLCERLKEYLNAPDIIERGCENAPVGLNGNLEIVQNGSEITADPHLKFVTTNGMKFYISNLMEYEVVKIIGDINGDGDTNDPGESIKDIMKYYIVYIDLNGDSKPNSVQPVGEYLPDIVPFALTSRGEAIPLGYPTQVNDYMSAKIKFPGVEVEKAGGSIDERQFSKSMTFIDAVCGAWGGETNYDIPYSFDLNNNGWTSEDNKPAWMFYQKDNLNGQICTGKTFYGDETPYSNTLGGCERNNFTCRVIVDTETTRRF